MKKTLMLFVSCFLLYCSIPKQMNNKQVSMASPHVVVYKTKADYFFNVPLCLSHDKKEISSYPHPNDVLFNGKPNLPTKLENGYLLDNRGINANVAFLKIDYDTYSKLAAPPLLEELKKMIIENDPLSELYDCGSRYDFKNVVEELNSKILSGKLSDYKRIK